SQDALCRIEGLSPYARPCSAAAPIAVAAFRPWLSRAFPALRRAGDRFHLLAHQRLAGPYPSEPDALVPDLDLVAALARERERRRRKIARVGEILAKMRAARVLARKGGGRDHAGYRDQALEVEPIVPAHVVVAMRAVDARAIELGVELAEAA